MPWEVSLKCRWKQVGGGTGLGSQPESLPHPQPLEGSIVCPPLGGVTLLVAITAGVPHVVQRHHHLVRVRVLVQLHHARHHRGPPICREHGRGKDEGGQRTCTCTLGTCCVPGTPQCSKGGRMITPIFIDTEAGAQRGQGAAREHTGVSGRARLQAQVRMPECPCPVCCVS